MDKLKVIAKKLLKTVLKTKFLIILLIILLIMAVLLPAIVYFIKIDDGSYDEDDWSNAPYAASTYTDNAEITSEGITTSETAEDLWKKMIKEGSNVDKYLNKPEELEKLMNAEIITQYPKIGSGQLDGIIEFERHKSNGDSSMLSYKSFEEFNTYIENNNSEALKYFTLDNNGNVLIAKKDEKIMDLKFNDYEFDYARQGFTEDDKQSNTHYKRTEVTISTETIDYKNMVQQYTMPFEYLWRLLVISEDKEFVMELANLVEKSEITISIYDNITTVVNESEWNYQKQMRTDTYAKVTPSTNYEVTGYPEERYWLAEDSPEAREGKYNSNYLADYLTDPTTYNAVKKETEKIDQLKMEVTKADVWIVDYKKEFEYQGSETQDEETNTATLDDSEYKEDSDSPKTSENDATLLSNEKAVSLATEAKQYIETKIAERVEAEAASNDIQNTQNTIETEEQTEEVIVNVTSVKCRTYTRKINRSKKTTNTESLQKYIAQTPTTREKVEKAREGEEEEDNFVTILCRHRKAKRIILETSDWLFQLLESDESTSNMVDLTKYLLNKVTESNRFGNVDFKLPEYDNSEFSSISTSGNILMDYLASWESGSVWQYRNGKIGYNDYIAKYITEDRTQYICYVDIGSTRNYGYGVCHTPDNGGIYWHVAEYQAEGIDIKSGQYDSVGISKIDTTIVDNVKMRLVNGYQRAVKNTLQRGGILEEMTQPQIDSLTCIMYQYGNIGNFVQAYKNYGNTDRLINEAHSNSGKTYFNSNVENNGRSQANWKLFHEGIYTTGTGEVLESESYATSGDFLQIAQSVWRTVCTTGRYTRYGGASSIPVRGPTIDCSSFVSWVLYEYGYKEEFNYQHDTSSFYNTNWKQKYGWEEIHVAAGERVISKLQPGDIFVRYGNGTHHVTIVAEITSNNKLLSYDCGNMDANWNGTNGEPVDKTYFLTKNAPGKIIRVKPAE